MFKESKFNKSGDSKKKGRRPVVSRMSLGQTESDEMDEDVEEEEQDHDEENEEEEGEHDEDEEEEEEEEVGDEEFDEENDAQNPS